MEAGLKFCDMPCLVAGALIWIWNVPPKTCVLRLGPQVVVLLGGGGAFRRWAWWVGWGVPEVSFVPVPWLTRGEQLYFASVAHHDVLLPQRPRSNSQVTLD